LDSSGDKHKISHFLLRACRLRSLNSHYEIEQHRILGILRRSIIFIPLFDAKAPKQALAGCGLCLLRLLGLAFSSSAMGINNCRFCSVKIASNIRAPISKVGRSCGVLGGKPRCVGVIQVL
jgi:hypothetical protein